MRGRAVDKRHPAESDETPGKPAINPPNRPTGARLITATLCGLMQKSHGLGGQVGDRVGKKVGDWVGNWVGETDGDRDGDSDGDSDGEELTANRQRTLELPSRKPAMTGSEPVTKPDTNPINPTSRQFPRR